MNTTISTSNRSGSKKPGIFSALWTPKERALKPGRCVTLFSASSGVPIERIARKLSTQVAVGEENTLLVEFVTGNAPAALKEWPQRASKWDGKLAFAEQMESIGDGVDHLQLRASDKPLEVGFLNDLLRHFRHHYNYLVFHAGAGMSSELLVECLVRSELAFLFFRQEEEHLKSLGKLCLDVKAHPEGECFHLKPVLYLEEEERAETVHEMFEHIGSLGCGLIHGHASTISLGDLRYLRNSRQCFEIQLRGLAREAGRRRLGMALSSGGAKGLAHIGVIQVLEENGIEVDVVAGCSMGAYVGSIWASGFDGERLESLAREMEGKWTLLRLVDPVFPPRRGFVRGHNVKKRIKKSIGDAHFFDMVRPLRVVATHFETLDRAVFANGIVADAVHASSAIPGVCEPVVINGETYVDGGISDPLPVDILEEMGVERIIAVNTIPTPSFLRCSREMEKEQAEMRDRHFDLKKRINQHLNYFAPGNILDIMMRAVHGAQIRVAEASCRRADVVLRPLAMGSRWYEFHKPEKYISVGRQVAEEHLDEIKSLLKGEFSPHEHSTTLAQMATVA